MQPNNNPVQPGAPVFHDVVPPNDNLGNPVNVAGASAPNPIAGTAAPQSSIIHEQPASDQALDSVLANVSNNIKATPAPQPKKGFFGGSKKTKTAPGKPISQPLASGPTKAKAKKPILPIAAATLAAIGLAAAAVLAYK